MLLHPWDSPGKNTGVGCCFLLQRIFPTQELNPGLLHCRQILYRLSYSGSPKDSIYVFKFRNSVSRLNYDFPGVQTVKHLLTMRETQVRSLGWEDPLEKETATHSSTLAWKIPWTEEPGRLHIVHRVTKSWTQVSNFNFTFTFKN